VISPSQAPPRRLDLGAQKGRVVGTSAPVCHRDLANQSIRTANAANMVMGMSRTAAKPTFARCPVAARPAQPKRCVFVADAYSSGCVSTPRSARARHDRARLHISTVTNTAAQHCVVRPDHLCYNGRGLMQGRPRRCVRRRVAILRSEGTQSSLVLQCAGCVHPSYEVNMALKLLAVGL
jgi:hypothetical protein